MKGNLALARVGHNVSYLIVKEAPRLLACVGVLDICVKRYQAIVI
jgi:hypothetical protein